MHEGPARGHRTPHRAARQAQADEVAAEQVLGRQQRALAGPLDLDLPAREPGAEAVRVPGQDQSPTGLAPGERRQQWPGRRVHERLAVVDEHDNPAVGGQRGLPLLQRRVGPGQDRAYAGQPGEGAQRRRVGRGQDDLGALGQQGPGLEAQQGAASRPGRSGDHGGGRPVEVDPDEVELVTPEPERQKQATAARGGEDAGERGVEPHRRRQAVDPERPLVGRYVGEALAGQAAQLLE